MQHANLNDLPENVKSRINGLRDMINNKASEGEKTNAQLLLDQILSKYNIKDIDLSSIDRKPRFFKVESNNPILQEFLHDIIRNVVTQSEAPIYWATGRSGRKVGYQVSLTDLEYVEITEKFHFHYQNLWKEFEAFQLSYIMANDLYCKKDPNKKIAPKQIGEESEADKEARRRMQQLQRKAASMSRFIDKKTHLKMLGKDENS